MGLVVLQTLTGRFAPLSSLRSLAPPLNPFTSSYKYIILLYIYYK